TDDDSSALVVRRDQFSKASEVKISLPKYQQAVVDSEFLYHGGFHHGPGTRYALITRIESGPASEQWMDSQLPYLPRSGVSAREGHARQGLVARGALAEL